MHVNKDTLLAVLPPFNNRLLLIEGAQDVPDIIDEVLEAHSYFSGDYDTIYQFFDFGTVRDICRGLFDFCKKNIKYIVEGEHRQTTKSPAAVLAQGYGDCKHYAGFIAGVLSAITRNTGKKISWRYRFASYNFLTSEPGHVYVVVTDRGDEIAIDPVLKTFNEPAQPVYIIDKKFKDMPLYRVSGIASNQVGFIDPITAAQTALSFIKLFTGDKVPNYPISSTDTLNKIRAEIQSLLPLPPTSLDNAIELLSRAEAYQAPLVGDTDNVRKTYYLIYGEVITALKNYIAQHSGGAQIDPATGLPVQGTGSGFLNTKTLLIGAAIIGGGYLLYKKTRRKKAVYGRSKLNLKTIALVAGGVWLISQMNKPAPAPAPAVSGTAIDCIN